MIIGLAGPNASGKGEAAALLAERGYSCHSLSDIVREAAKAQGLPPEREHLIRIGQELRREGGAGVLAERILERLGERAVVDSIRAPAEVEVLRRRPDFRLLAVDAPVALRFERAMERGRAGDATTLEAFHAQEARENSDDPAAQQVMRAIALADERVLNDASREELHARILAVVTAWESGVNSRQD